MNDDNKNLITKEGEKKLRDELNNLINVIRPQVIEELKEARAQGDLSENADYDAARNRQAEVEGRVRQIEDSLHNVKIIRENHNNKMKEKVKLGSIVVYSKIDDKSLFSKNKEVKIVGAVEANPLIGTISNESPLAKAIFYKSIGDIAEVKTPRLVYKLKIISIK